MIWVSKDLDHWTDDSGMLADEVTILGKLYRKLTPIMWEKLKDQRLNGQMAARRDEIANDLHDWR